MKIMQGNCMSFLHLGEGNGYTEEDIIETAKALTGYVERGEIGCEQVTI